MVNWKYFFDGLKSFSIQKPRARNYVHEWIFHKFAKEVIFPAASCLAHNPLYSTMPKEWLQVMQSKALQQG